MKPDPNAAVRTIGLRITRGQYQAIKEHAERMKAQIGPGMRVTWSDAARQLIELGLDVAQTKEGEGQNDGK